MKPMPPEHLRLRVSMYADEGDFGTSGWHSAGDFRRALAAVSVHFANQDRILEWGCGCGRMLAHLPVDLDKQELHGCDIDGEAIDWLRENYPRLQVIQSGELPPLPYEDGFFDLVVNHSVLTHLDEEHQDAWLAELGRIVKPEGAIALTVHGPWALKQWIKSLPDTPDTAAVVGACREALDTKGIYFHVDDAWARDFPAYYQSTFHEPWYVFEHWTKYFDIKSYVPRGSGGHQDLIVLGHKRDR